MPIDLLCQIIAKINTFIFFFKPAYPQKGLFASSYSLVVWSQSWGSVRTGAGGCLKTQSWWSAQLQTLGCVSTHIIPPRRVFAYRYHLTSGFEGLCKIFLLPKKRGETELLVASDPAGTVCACRLAGARGAAAARPAAWLRVELGLRCCSLGISLFRMLRGGCWRSGNEIQAVAVCACDTEPEGGQGFFPQVFCCFVSSLGRC